VIHRQGENVLAENNASNESQIRMLVENWARAVRQGKMEGVLAHHTNDIMMFDVIPPLQIKGIAAYEKTWELFFSCSPGGPGSFDLIDLEITANDTVAFCHARVNVSGIKVRLTMGFRKLQGEWLIVHEHHSALTDVEQEQ
jgi:ketosteroid isomerase-like protein